MICLPTRQTGTYSFPNNRSFVTSLHLLVSCTALKSKHDGVRESFHFLFRPHCQGSSFKIMLPTLNQFETLVENFVSFFSEFVQTVFLLSAFYGLYFSIATTVLFFWGCKTPWTPMPMATMELKHCVCF